MKKRISTLLCIILIISMLPNGVYAAALEDCAAINDGQSLETVEEIENEDDDKTDDDYDSDESDLKRDDETNNDNNLSKDNDSDNQDNDFSDDMLSDNEAEISEEDHTLEDVSIEEILAEDMVSFNAVSEDGISSNCISDNSVSEDGASYGSKVIVIYDTVINPYLKNSSLSMYAYDLVDSPYTITGAVLNNDLKNYFTVSVNEANDRIYFVPLSEESVGGVRYSMTDPGHEMDRPAFIDGLLNSGNTSSRVFNNVEIIFTANDASEIKATIPKFTLSGSMPKVNAKTFTLNDYYKPSYNQFPRTENGICQSIDDYVTFSAGSSKVNSNTLSYEFETNTYYEFIDESINGKSTEYIRYKNEDLKAVSSLCNMTASSSEYWGGYPFSFVVVAKPTRPVITVKRNNKPLLNRDFVEFDISAYKMYNLSGFDTVTVKNESVSSGIEKELINTDLAGSKTYGEYTLNSTYYDNNLFLSTIGVRAHDAVSKGASGFSSNETFLLRFVPENKAAMAEDVIVNASLTDNTYVSYKASKKSFSLVRHYINSVLSIHTDGIKLSAVNNDAALAASYIRVSAPSKLKVSSYDIIGDLSGNHVTEKDLTGFEPIVADTDDTFSLIDTNGDYSNERLLMIEASDSYGQGLTDTRKVYFRFYDSSDRLKAVLSVDVSPESGFEVNAAASETINLALPLNQWLYDRYRTGGDSQVMTLPVRDENGDEITNFSVSGQKDYFDLVVKGNTVSFGTENKVRYKSVPENISDIKASSIYLTGDNSQQYHIFMDYLARKISVAPNDDYAKTKSNGNIDTLYLTYVDENKLVSNTQKVTVKYTYTPELSASQTTATVYTDKNDKSTEIKFYSNGVMYSNGRFVDEIVDISLDQNLLKYFNKTNLTTVLDGRTVIYGIKLKLKDGVRVGAYSGTATISLSLGSTISRYFTFIVENSL